MYFVAVPLDLLTNPNITDAEFRMEVAIRSFANYTTGIAFPKQSTLESRVHKKNSTIRGLINSLEKKGRLSKWRKSTGSNCYQVTPIQTPPEEIEEIEQPPESQRSDRQTFSGLYNNTNKQNNSKKEREKIPEEITSEAATEAKEIFNNKNRSDLANLILDIYEYFKDAREAKDDPIINYRADWRNWCRKAATMHPNAYRANYAGGSGAKGKKVMPGERITFANLDDWLSENQNPFAVKSDISSRMNDRSWAEGFSDDSIVATY